MAPTCYNNMKNLHYRTQSLPEAVYTNHMLHMRHPDFHQPLLQANTGKIHTAHQSSSIKKRNALRRSQTSVCDMVPNGGHHRAPLTAGVYEAFLPPPNFNAIGLPVTTLTCNMARPRTRTQSFYVPSHYRTSSLSQHRLNHVGSQHDIHRSDHGGSPYSINHSQAVSHRDIGMLNDQKNFSPNWYHRSVPNISRSFLPQAKSVTTPLFVDCSVEYDLGEQPVIPADSEPLLSIHPEYVAATRSVTSSPYSMLQYQSSPSHVGSTRLQTGNSPDDNKQLESHKSMPDIQASHVRRANLQHEGLARRTMIPKTSSRVRSNRTSPRARSNLNSKLEATRKLSVESRDSGIGLMNSAGTLRDAASSSTQWLMYNQGCDSNNADQADYACFTSGQLPQKQTEYTGKVLPTNNNKRFALTDLVTGLLCCSVPVYQNEHIAAHHDNHLQMEWHAERMLDSQMAVMDSHVSTPNTKDDRTSEWVMASQKMMDQCRAGHCGQDCGDGFCYNVWSNMVHV